MEKDEKCLNLIFDEKRQPSSGFKDQQADALRMNSPKDNEQRDEEKENDLHGSKLSIEEQGGQCPDQTVHEEQQERKFKAILYRRAKFYGFIQHIVFKLFLLFGTATELEAQLQTIKNVEECDVKNPGIQVPYQSNNPREDQDCFVTPIPGCSKEIKLRVQETNKDKCHCEPPLKNCFPIDEIKNQSKLCVKGVPDMRLSKTPLPAFFEFSLRCKTKSEPRTPTRFYIIITPVDGDQKETHAPLKILYPVCFNDAEAGGLTTGKTDSQAETYVYILRNNFEIIKRMIKQVGKVIESLVDKEVLHEDFCETISLSSNKTGELLQHLCRLGNILPQFIQALQESGSNEELIDFLQQCVTSTEVQNSSL